MRQRLPKGALLLWLSFLILLTTLVEMRPGRLYQMLTYLLFQDSISNLMLFLLCLGLSVIGFLCLLLNRNKWIFSITLLSWIPCLLISLSYRFITGYNFMYADAVLAWNNLSLASTAVQSYDGPLLLSILSTSTIISLVYWGRKKTNWRAVPMTSLLTILVAVAVYTLIKWSTGILDDFPALYRVPLTITAAATDQLPQPVRAQVSVKPTNKGIPHLFFIVDESITATELSIHDSAKKTTPFLASVQEQLLDFGVASSFANQSAGSNIALMSGTRPSELPDTVAKTFYRSNIFQFAKNAGYETYYIDAQLGGNLTLQNFMSPEDVKSIDHLVRPAALHTEATYDQRDMLVAQELARLSKHKKKVFAYVIKAGAHWPYARTYPEDSAFFQPVLSARSLYKDPVRTLNTYHNSLRWTVDEFWRKLMTTIQPQDSTVIIYTSDHGQNLTQAGISLSHASVYETSSQEAAVPLWIWNPAQLIPIKKVEKKNIYSHAHIFPTLLQLQGYSAAWVKKKYGLSLLDTPPVHSPQRYFLSGDLFGRGPHALVPFQWPAPATKK